MNPSTQPESPRALVAAVDVGTVSTRLIAALVDPAGAQAPRVLERQARITDLGEGVDASGALAPQAVARTVGAVAGYVARVRELAAAQGAPAHVVATTTSAARDARNADDLLGPLRALGLAPQVIAGQTEAALALLGVTADFGTRPVLVADVGGGSTELTAGRRSPSGALEQSSGASYNVGCRRVTERFFADGAPAAPEAVRAARAFVSSALAPHFGPGARALPRELVCVGGTATSLVAVANRLVPYDSSFVHLHRMGRAELGELTGRLLALSAVERAALPGLQPKRAGVVAAGALILDVLLELGEWDGYTASESDSLIGLLDCAGAVLGGRPAPVGWAPDLAVIA